MASEMATSQDFATWTCGPRIEPRFLLHVLRGMAPDLKRISMGSTHKTIYMPDIEQLRTPIPPLDEQRRIADFLDAEVSRIDRLVAARTHQICLLQEHAKALVSEALLPGILSAPEGVWPWRWLPALPSDRPLVRLGYVCRIQNGLTIDSRRDTSGNSITLPYLRVANVQAGYVSLENVTEVTVPREMAARAMLRPGDVLMTEGGDLDKLGRGTVWRGELPECLHQNHVFALRPDASRLDGEYLALMTQTVHGRCYFESTGVKTTNLASTNSGKILSFPILLPKVEVQRTVVAEVQRAQAGLNRANAVLEKQLSLLSERRRALITAAVTGQLDISTASGRNITQGV